MFNSKRARQMVNDEAQKYTFNAIDSFVGTYTNSQKNKARHELEIMDKKNTQNLIRQLDLIIGLRYMVSTNIDVSDGLFNGARSLNGLYILGAFKPPNEIKPDDNVNAEMNRLRQNPLVPKYQFLRVVPENVIQIVSHNTQSIRKHITTIVSDQVFSSSHIVTLQENITKSINGRPRAFGTINFCKLNIEPRIVDRFEIEKGNSNNHVEISDFKLDNRLTIINVYNNPSSSLELLKETLLEVKDYIDESENILILGDFNHELKLGNQLESLMLGTFGTSLFSPRESTTNARTVIDGVFGRIDDYNVEVFIYESYASHHKPLVIRVHEL
ncbi:hypothetical protein PVAND_001256 [Polypedilum vanderplanki]|uniref:Endonuclease/exonuclease/phosphatase domain-containing protein n=1 Tax=Polypedilum vanderplanki TaxID=319348 RepID=A0A9J6BNP6_POLVA|nr:hypothetical protein PVAND_001256 [Polypedilum vanderplanki]